MSKSRISNPTAAEAIKNAGTNRKKQHGIDICKKAKCARIFKNECMGWTDIPHMWLNGTCPHLTHDKNTVKNIFDAYHSKGKAQRLEENRRSRERRRAVI